jgi:hypothetical protein
MPNPNEVPNGNENERLPQAEGVSGVEDEAINWQTTVTNEQVQRILEETEHPTEDPAIAFAKVLEQYPALREVMKEDYYARSVRGILLNVRMKHEAFGDKLPRFLEIIGKSARDYLEEEIDAAGLKEELENLHSVSKWTPGAIKEELNQEVGYRVTLH